MDGVVAAGVTFGITAVAAVGTGVVALYRPLPWKHALPLISTVFVFLPLFFFDRALESAVGAIEDFLNYPRDVYHIFLDYKPTLSPLCTEYRNKALNESLNYNIPDIDDVQNYVDDYRPFIYVVGAVVVGLATVTIAVSRWPAPARLGIGVNVLSGALFSVVFAAFIGVAYAIRQLCKEHGSKDNLDDQVRWFVDSSMKNNGLRPWVENIDAFLNECGGEITPALNRTLYPGALEGPFDDLHEAICTKSVASLEGTGAVVGVGFFLWLALCVFYIATKPQSKGSSGAFRILVGNLNF